MELDVNGNTYVSSYFPFFRMEQHEGFDVWGLRLPSGKIEDVLVFEQDQPLTSLKDYTRFLINEYILEEDDTLTPRAIQFKKELEELFCRNES
jgi:hypothetical protein